MANLYDVISDVIEAEGGAKVSNDPSDAGGRTQYGISEKANPKAWADGKVTEQEAREIYTAKYVVWPKFHTIPPSHAKIQAQLIDMGVLSGPQHTIQKLQEILGVKTDGDFGPKTLAALIERDSREINNLLIASRIRMIGRIVAKSPSQAKFVSGRLNRCLDFLIP